VDDNEVNRRFMGGLLRRAGYEIRLATNGFEAVDCALSEPFALVLMDLHMPDMDGIEATACIRESESGIRHTPIVAMTGDSAPGDVARFRDAGMDGLLAKPVSPDQLRAEVEKWTS
jgi:CheY-like chemotaxis protein